MKDVPEVGGKNASLGEMIATLSAAGVRVPGGFATTAHAFRQFMHRNGLDGRIVPLLAELDIDDVTALAEAGRTIRRWIEQSPLPDELELAIRKAYGEMGEPAVAVRSSATAEDLPEASFAGQQETFLNVQGIDQVLARISHHPSRNRPLFVA